VTWQINRHPNAYMAFDHNRKRTARDTLKWLGVDKPGEIQAAATSLYQYYQGFFRGKAYRGARGGDRFPTDAQVQKVVKMHPGLNKHLWKNPFKGKGLSVGALCAASYVLHNIDQKMAEVFYESLVEGINIPSTRHPLAILRRTFMGMGESERQRNGETMAHVFKAWNAYVFGGGPRWKEIEGLPTAALRKDDVFPEPISPDDLEPRSPFKAAGGSVQ